MILAKRKESTVITIGKRIRELREARGMSRFDLSIAARVRESNLVNWELGKSNPGDMAALVRIAHVFDVTAEDLVGGAEQSMAREDAARYGAGE